jgi:hypothetical protein
MSDRSFPLNLLIFGNLKLGADDQEEQRFLSGIIEQGLKADRHREGWLERQRRLSRLRYGIRKPKSFPWKGASNISIPLIDSQIRRFKPILMRLLVEADPVVEFVGDDAAAVSAERIAEAEYNWLFKTHMNALEPMAYVIDSLAHRGYGIAQVSWDYQTEYEVRVIAVKDLFPSPPAQPGAPPPPPPPPDVIRQMIQQEYDLPLDDARVARALDVAVDQIQRGAEFVKLGFRRVITDRPAIWDRDPVQVIAPIRTTDYPNAEWVIIQHILSTRKLKQMEADGYFEKGSVSKVVGRNAEKPFTMSGDMPAALASSGLYLSERLEDEKDRVWGVEDDDNVLVWEVFHWFDYDNDSLLDRCHTFIHPRTRTKLSSRPYAYPFHKWPFVKFDFEKTSRRFHSPRGISQMLEGLQREVNHQHNARLDGMTLRNAPIWQVPTLAGFKSRNFRIAPGSVLHMQGGAEIKPLVQDHRPFGDSVAEENLLRSLAEQYIGVFDNAITSAAGQGTRRTATEINAAVQLSASTASLDTILFQLQMKELHTMVWELWMDLRPKEVSYKVNGLDPSTNEPVLVTIRKSEIDKRFTLYPTGTIANTNRALELANAKEALGIFLQDQSGLINPLELRKWYFDLLDFRRARRIVNNAQQAQELQTLRQAAEAVKDPRLMAQLGAGGPQQPQELPGHQMAEVPE